MKKTILLFALLTLCLATFGQSLKQNDFTTNAAATFSSLTNGLAGTNYVRASTNGFIGPVQVTNTVIGLGTNSFIPLTNGPGNLYVDFGRTADATTNDSGLIFRNWSPNNSGSFMGLAMMGTNASGNMVMYDKGAFGNYAVPSNAPAGDTPGFVAGVISGWPYALVRNDSYSAISGNYSIFNWDPIGRKFMIGGTNAPGVYDFYNAGWSPALVVDQTHGYVIVSNASFFVDTDLGSIAFGTGASGLGGGAFKPFKLTSTSVIDTTKLSRTDQAAFTNVITLSANADGGNLSVQVQANGGGLNQNQDSRGWSLVGETKKIATFREHDSATNANSLIFNTNTVFQGTANFPALTASRIAVIDASGYLTNAQIDITGVFRTTDTNAFANSLFRLSDTNAFAVSLKAYADNATNAGNIAFLTANNQFTGNSNAFTRIAYTGAAPTIATNGGNGTGGSVTLINPSSDAAGSVTWVSGASTVANTNVFTVTFQRPFLNVPVVMWNLTGADVSTCLSDLQRVNVAGITTTGFILMSGGTAPIASKTVTFQWRADGQ